MSISPAEFDPVELDHADLPELAVVANRYHTDAESHARSALECAWRAGRALLAAKRLCRHGQWKPWVKSNFDGSYRTAAAYMQLASKVQSSALLDPGLSINAALKAIAEPRTDGDDNTLTDPFERDRELQRDVDALMEHRWHWTLDESNPDRVSIADYAHDVGADEREVRVDAHAWANYLKAGGTPPGSAFTYEEARALTDKIKADLGRLRTSGGFTIPDTIEGAVERLAQIAEEQERLQQMGFEVELARFHAAPDGTAEKNAYSVGLWSRHKHRWARRAYEQSGAQSVEEFARMLDAAPEGVAVLLANDDAEDDES